MLYVINIIFLIYMKKILKIELYLDYGSLLRLEKNFYIHIMHICFI